jgi:hypothetical protein
VSSCLFHPGWIVPLLAFGLATDSLGQEDPQFITRTQPYPLFYQIEPRPYNLRWGPVSARLHGSLQVELNDNINLSEHDAAADAIIHPQFGLGFVWPLSEQNLLRFDLGVGYRAYIDNPSLNSIQVTPGSHLNYQIRVLKAELIFHDSFYIQVDPLSRPEISGGDELFNFERFNNSAGVQLNWEIMKDLKLLAGYDYVIDRSLSSDFTELDRDDHVFSVAAYREIGPRVTLGLAGSYTITEYVEQIQNDGTTFSIGPRAIIKFSEFVSMDAGVNYTVSEYRPTGMIPDANDFEGVTYFAGVRHRINSRTSHYARASRSVTPGLGSNFTDMFAVQYGIDWKASSAITLHSTFVYEDLRASGAVADESVRYLWYLGAQLRLSSKWQLGAAYSFAWKDSHLPDRDYRQNRMTLDLMRQF